MKRIKSIDTFRGLCMVWLISAHIIPQWLNPTLYNLHIWYFIWNINDAIGACAFLFLSGISSFISFKNRKQKSKQTKISMKRFRNEYYFRALLIFLMGFIVNIGLAIFFNMWWWIIAWDFLQSLSVCLFLAWPLFKTPKSFRIFIGVLFWIINEIILYFIRPAPGQDPSLLFLLLYTTQQLDSVLWFFTFFIIGTVIGEIIYNAFTYDDEKQRKTYLQKKLFIPFIIISLILITLGILLELPDLYEFYAWASIRSLPWRIYALGLDILIICLLLLIEEYEIFKFKKHYRFLFYFSYYSLTVYASHYLLTLIFLNMFNADILLWLFLITTIILFGLLLNVLYKKLGAKISIKVQISRLSVALADIIQERKKNEMRL